MATDCERKAALNNNYWSISLRRPLIGTMSKARWISTLSLSRPPGRVPPASGTLTSYSFITDIKMDRYKFAYCVTTDTPKGFPYVDLVTPGLGVAIGGCGHAAKSSDEIGKMAAR